MLSHCLRRPGMTDMADMADIAAGCRWVVVSRFHVRDVCFVWKSTKLSRGLLTESG